MFGQSYDHFALALSQALSVWAIGQPQNLALTGAVVGVSGVGAVNPVLTRLTVPPSVPVMVGALVSAGAAGPMASSLGSAVATGVSSAFTASGQFTGLVAGVGNGVSTARVTVANPATLASAISTALSPVFGAGPALTILVPGLSNGISAVLLLGTGTGQVVGTSTIPPAPFTTVAIHTVI